MFVRLLCAFCVLSVSISGILAPSTGHAAITGSTANRFALVIGNAKYASLTPLDSPENDAREIARVLRTLNFKVTLKTNLDLRSMQKAIKDFGKSLKRGGVALFYYSGHGLQVDLVNYLIPIGGAVKYAEDIPASSIDANAVLREFRAARTAFNFFILDACRNNGLKRKDKNKVQGLAEMDAPKGTLIAYATGPNKLASDGANGHSLYTLELLKFLDKPGLQVEQVFKRVRQRVHEVSLGDQLPVEYTSLTRDFYFRPVRRIVTAPIVTPDGPAVPSRITVVPIDERYEAQRKIVVRSEPRNAARAVGRLAAREAVRAIGRVKDRDWVKIAMRGGVAGFVPDYLLREPFTWKVVSHDGSLEVLEATSLYRQPRSASTAVARLRVGQKITATGRVRGLNWLRVKTGDGRTGFVRGSMLREPFAFRVVAYSGIFETTSNVKLLDQPRISSRQIASLDLRERVTAVGRVRNRNWLKVRRKNGVEGFVRESLLSIPFEWREKKLKPKTYKIVGAATLRTEPRSTAQVVASLTVLQSLTVVAKVEGRDWLKVQLKSKKLGERHGYVLENLLQRVVVRPDAKIFKKGDEFRDCPACPLMVAIPPGTFTMGSTSGKRSERPTRTVAIQRMFALGKFEVTFKEWAACVAAGGCRSSPSDQGWGRGNRPVINVSWDDTQEFVRWLTKKTGERYHLPSEAQWEYAARATSNTKYAWGDSLGDNQANCKGCGSKWSGDRTAPAGSFRKNAFGLHDMHGNVWEWMEDCWHRNYRRAPKDGRAWTGGACQQSVIRGGSFSDGANYASSSARARYFSAPRYNFGFRVARIIGG